MIECFDVFFFFSISLEIFFLEYLAFICSLNLASIIFQFYWYSFHSWDIFLLSSTLLDHTFYNLLPFFITSSHIFFIFLLQMNFWRTLLSICLFLFYLALNSFKRMYTQKNGYGCIIVPWRQWKIAITPRK